MRNVIAALIFAACLMLPGGGEGVRANTPERDTLQVFSVVRPLVRHHSRSAHVKKFRRGRHKARHHRRKGNIYTRYGRHLSRGPSVSTFGLPGPLVAKIRQIQSACPGFRVISAFRPGARIAGANHRSLHAVHRAADISGPDYRCAYRQLRGWAGGVSTDAWRMAHIHMSWNPGGQEWGSRFAHYRGAGRHYTSKSWRGKRYANYRKHRRYARR